MNVFSALLSVTDDAPAPQQQLRRQAVASILAALKGADSATAAAKELGISYRDLLRLSDQHPELKRAYDRTAQTKHRA